MTHALYFNGLGSGKTRWRELIAMHYLAKKGISVEHIGIDWYSKESFEDLLARLVIITKDKLRTQDTLLLIGSSAGGSLAVNVLGALHSENLYAITLCSRLALGKLPWWDYRTLRRMAHIHTKKESRKFYDSIVHCHHIAIPQLSSQDKLRIITIKQLADDVVPRSTMQVPGVRSLTVPALGHGWGIAMATHMLPRIVRWLKWP